MAGKAYAAFLRGVSPMNAKMPLLRKTLEDAGFENVRTVLSSGNATFITRERAKGAALQRQVEEVIAAGMKRRFRTILRPIEDLQALIEADPYRSFRLSSKSKRIVTFLNEAPPGTLTLPLQHDNACLYRIQGLDVFGAYEPQPNNPAFMVLIEKTFGKEVTTRTWDTVKKVAASQS